MSILPEFIIKIILFYTNPRLEDEIQQNIKTYEFKKCKICKQNIYFLEYCIEYTVYECYNCSSHTVYLNKLNGKHYLR